MDYDDIINLPHHISNNHKQMSQLNRAAQFASFAALSGYEAAVSETARLTENKREISDGEKEVIDLKLRYITEHFSDKPIVSVTHFVKDKFKSGGSYVTQAVNIKKIDNIKQCILLSDNSTISFDNIYSIDGEMFSNWEL